MSDSGLASDTGLETEKLSPDDPSLALVAQPVINKKLMKIILGSFGGIMGIAIIVALTPPDPNAAKAKAAEESSHSKTIPGSLMISDSDYTEPIEPTVIPEQQPSMEDRYKTYGKDNVQPVIIQPKGEDGKDINQRFSNPLEGMGSDISENQRKLAEEAAHRAPMTWDQGPSDHSLIGSDEERARNAQISDDRTAAAINGSSAVQREMINSTDYSKANQQAQKKQFLESSRVSYGDYLDNSYTESVDPIHEVKATTVIPMILLTGINSDLPGQIIGQVSEDVRDTITGTNILIPAGSRILGTYDSSITFGQNRVLLVWDRLIRPDGVSVRLQGMNGVDLSGYAGLPGGVDTHIGQIIGSVSLSSVFQVLVDGITSTLAAVPGLVGGVGTNLTKSDKQTAIDNAVNSYLTKLVNQQPTIIVPEGSRGYIMVGRDIILPDIVGSNTKTHNGWR